MCYFPQVYLQSCCQLSLFLLSSTVQLSWATCIPTSTVNPLYAILLVSEYTTQTLAQACTLILVYIFLRTFNSATTSAFGNNESDYDLHWLISWKQLLVISLATANFLESSYPTTAFGSFSCIWLCTCLIATTNF